MPYWHARVLNQLKKAITARKGKWPAQKHILQDGDLNYAN